MDKSSNHFYGLFCYKYGLLHGNVQYTNIRKEEKKDQKPGIDREKRMGGGGGYDDKKRQDKKCIERRRLFAWLCCTERPPQENS
jgi:hypothetical protein